MVLSDLLMLSKSKSLFDWMLALGNIPLMPFVDFIDSLLLWVVFIENNLSTYYYVSFSFPFYIKKKKKKIESTQIQPLT